MSHWFCNNTHTILCHKKYFSNLVSMEANVNVISGPINLIQAPRRVIIVLPNRTKFHMDDVLYSTGSRRIPLNFKDVYWNWNYIKNKIMVMLNISKLLHLFLDKSIYWSDSFISLMGFKIQPSNQWVICCSKLESQWSKYILYFGMNDLEPKVFYDIWHHI